MSRVHDMGGRFGDGAVAPETEPVFKQEWHARALAVTLAAGALGQWNLDTSRHARERLSPQDYTAFGYYEIWISALADLLVEKGVLTEAELQAGKADGPGALADRCLGAADVAGVLARGGPSARDGGPAPLFHIGDRVRTRRLGALNATGVAGGHTRLPGYAAGIEGQVIRCHGCHVLPDASAHGQGDAPEPLYAVCFDAADLWGQGEAKGDEVVLDLWQSYLEPAT